MPRWIGLIGSWAFLVLAVGLIVIGVTAETMNLREDARFDRVEMIDGMVAERLQVKLNTLLVQRGEVASEMNRLSSELESKTQEIEELQDGNQVVVVSTMENKVYLVRNGKTEFEAVASTGKGTKLVEGGRVMVFNTPIGKFRIQSKETDPVWVPPDWHYVEEARKRGTRVVRLGYGDAIDADTGGPVRKARGGGFWSMLGEERRAGSHRIMKVQGNNVVVVSGGRVIKRFPKGSLIRAGRAIVIPPVGTEQRKFDRVLGTHRLNLGDGYALHGTQAVDKLGQSVSHGCVRLSNEDIAKLYSMTNVGDEVVIY